ncbi:glycosyltransferase family 4 protein [Roseomonas rosulenta]|uniref:glycosyltransferase family 4 protein n=1 Tax=Roseomonas rosulenta TaxID=2748667 RepID=UPI0018E03ABF|nr:glycosyltransferase [Roseomonas rosulenta]
MDGQRHEGAPDERLRQADALRDQRLWDAAAAAYRAHLAAHPADWRAQIQLGHCLKESGDPSAALVAYRAAEALARNNADVHLQIGHALKLTGNVEQAWRSYARALELDPSNEEASREAAALSRLASPLARSARTPGQAVQVVFDTSDLVAYFRSDRTPTGIQRVQLSITARALLDPIEGAATVAVAFDSQSGGWREIARDLFLRLWRLSRTGGDPLAPDWVEAVAALDAALRSGDDFVFAPGASLVNLGTSWWIPDYFLRVRDAVRLYGVRYVPLIYDCIPLVAPEHCHQGLVDQFAEWFSAMAALADSALAISEWSAADARRIAREVVPERDLAVTVVRLDADLRRDLGTAVEDAWPERSDLPGPHEPFVLCVGTIESRKNHLLLFHAWLTLLRKHGAARVPRLVCVGKAGWLADAAMTLWRNSPALQAKVSVAHGVPDVALAALYGRAMFTVTNSFYEGWGLPVTESLAFGRVPLVARNTSLTEAGGEAAVYFEPMNEPDLVAKLETLIFDEAERARREAIVASTTRLRSWGEIADQVMREVLDRADRPDRTPRLPVALGETYVLGLPGGGQADRAKAVADLLRDGLNWNAREPWGVWTRPGIARLRLTLPEDAPAGPLRVYIGLLAPGAPVTIGLRAFGADAGPPGFATVAAPANGAFTCVLDVAQRGQEVLVEIDGGKGVQLGTCDLPDGRMAGIGVTSLMICTAGDIAARVGFLEQQTFRVLRPT